MTFAAPVPTVVGPIEGANPPWGAPRVDLAERGYVVEEYQIEGTATAYCLVEGAKPTPDGRWDVQEWAEADYRTRLLVVRPQRADRFNGTVVVNWQNVSAGYEGGPPSSGEIYEGYAWVGVSAQEIGIYGFPAGMERRMIGRGLPLVATDPERYRSLVHPGDQCSFDIFAQAGRAVGPDRAPAIDPLAGLDVQRVVAAGGSQSAMRLVTFLNVLHPHAPVYDGFLLAVWEGKGPRPEEGSIPLGTRTAIRADTETPVIVVNSEFEAPSLAQVPMHDTEALRVWEVTGTPHGVARTAEDVPSRDGWITNRLSYGSVHEAALRALHQWLRDGRAPQTQPRIAFTPGSPPAITRDERGNAIGGIRLPEVAAPTHEYRGMSFGTGRPPLFGAARPLPESVLRDLYPSRAVFTDRWNAAVDELVASGALRPEDAPGEKARANTVELPHLAAPIA